MGTGKAHANIETVQTNLIGAIAQIDAALEIFREQNHGHLVLISSIAGVRPAEGADGLLGIEGGPDRDR